MFPQSVTYNKITQNKKTAYIRNKAREVLQILQYTHPLYVIQDKDNTRPT